MVGDSKEIDKAVDILWNYMLLHHGLERCDIIFLLGNRDERTARYAADIYRRGFAPKIIVSGGVSRKNDMLWKDKYCTEAQHFSILMQSHGVPAEVIIEETKAQNTGENILFSYELLMSLGISLSSVMLIQKPYMERRAYATFMKQWPVANSLRRVIVSSPTTDRDEWFSASDDIQEDIAVMVGDVQRMSIYVDLGYQISQDIPKSVKDATKKLIDAGFNKHYIQH